MISMGSKRAEAWRRLWPVWAIDRMGEAIHPTADQITSLAQLKSAVQASEIFATSCASAVPITPVGRLDVDPRASRPPLPRKLS